MPGFGSEGSSEKLGSDQEVVWQGVLLLMKALRTVPRKDLRNLRNICSTFLLYLSSVLESRKTLLRLWYYSLGHRAVLPEV